MEEKIKWVLELLKTVNMENRFYRETLSELAQEHKFEISFGASKAGLIFKDWNWVVKIDKPGYKDCEREAKLYLKAKELRIEKAFLETRFVGTTESGMKVYIQPKIDMVMADLGEKQIRKIQNKTSNVKADIAYKAQTRFCSYPSNLWTKLAILTYGKKFMLVLEQFTNDYSINDLHNCNIGLLNNKPVLLDYSGYHGNHFGYTID